MLLYRETVVAELLLCDSLLGLSSLSTRLRKRYLQRCLFRVDLEKVPVVHPLVTLDLCKLMHIPALQECVEEVLQTSDSMTDVQTIQVYPQLNPCQIEIPKNVAMHVSSEVFQIPKFH